MRWRDVAAELEAHAGFREAYEQQFPYANVALAVVALRERHGLSQRALAERIGSPQPVIARLESGRHPVEIKLLARIAAAVGEPWSVTFVPSLEAGDEPREAGSAALGAGDPLLDAFNAANTASDFEAAAAVAATIALDPSTPRRRLALALDAYNRGDHDAAERWGRDALAAEGLPEPSREVATLVVGRAALNQGRSREALRVLRPLKNPKTIGWLRDAALAEALLESDQAEAAQAAVDRILSATADPEAHYLAARIYWHRDHVWPALEQVVLFRAAHSDDLAGLLLHGSILGFIGDLRDDAAAHQAALALFRRAKPSGDCEALRLYATTAARLGDWKAALADARRLARKRDGHDADRHQHEVEHIVAATFEHLPDEADMVAVIDKAEGVLAPDHDILRTQRALVAATSGDVAGAAAALGVDLDAIEVAPVQHQLVIAGGHLASGAPREALQILVRHTDSLPVPEGLLRLAATALEIDEGPTARAALERLAESVGPTAEVAALASQLLRNLERANESATVTGVLSDAIGWSEVVRPRPVEQTTDSTWEGPHVAGSAVMDRLTRAFLN
jgi:transcriptional regulator with XRE-family HTH domain